MKVNLGELLRMDALDMAEKITGESTHDMDSAATKLGFAMHLSLAETKRKALDEAGDTNFSNTLERYREIIEANGFEEVLALPFKGQTWGDGAPATDETFYVFANRQDGLLLTFDTFGGDRVNGGKVRYCWQPNDIENRDWSITSSGGLVEPDYKIWVGDHDCREALIFNMNQLRENGKFVTPWVKRPFMWMLHYMDTKDKEYDYNAINAERIAMLPEWVREFIGA